MDELEAVAAVIVEELAVEAREVVPAAKLGDDLGADSLDKVELIMALEQRYNIRISDSDAKTLLTVQDVLDYIQKIKAKKAEELRCEMPATLAENAS